MAKRPHSEQRRPSPGRVPRNQDELNERLPPEIRKELDGLRQHEQRILKGLQDPALHDLFLRNPAAALAKMDISISPALRAHLLRNAGIERNPSARQLVQPTAFLLPNGQTIQPKVSIHITGEGKSSHGR